MSRELWYTTMSLLAVVTETIRLISEVSSLVRDLFMF